MSEVVNGGIVALTDAYVSGIFCSAVSAFNARNWPALGALLDSSVMAITVHSRGVVQGSANVMSYLAADIHNTSSASGKDEPHFIVSLLAVHSGIATGIGCWTDPPSPSEVNFNFRVSNGGKIVSMIAPESGRTCTSGSTAQGPCAC